MNRYTHKILDHLPSVPEHFLHEAQILAQTQPEDRQKNTTLNSYNPTFKTRVLTINGQQTPTARAKRFIVSKDFQEWIQNNIAADFVEASVSITESQRDGVATAIHGAHTDWSRTFVLMYVMDTGGAQCETVFYQEHDQPIWRTDLGCFVTDYSRLTEIDSVTIPLATWYSIDSTVLHGVRNIERDRVAIHVGLQGSDQSIIKSTVSHV